MNRWFVVSLCAAVMVGLLATVGTAADKPKKGKPKVKLPAAAKGFAGMIEGKVVAVKKRGLVLEVKKIGEVWKHSKAQDPKSLVGVKVRIVCRKEQNKPAPRQVKYLATLKPGDTTVLDVANKKGNILVLLELTQEQREKVQ